MTVLCHGAVQPNNIPDGRVRHGSQIGQALSYDFGLGSFQTIYFISFVTVGGSDGEGQHVCRTSSWGRTAFRSTRQQPRLFCAGALTFCIVPTAALSVEYTRCKSLPLNTWSCSEY